MGKLEEMVQAWGELPTIMDIEQEIDVMNDLMELSLEDISLNKELFEEILGDLDLSHWDSGHYQLTRENEIYFKKFDEWLEFVYRKFDWQYTSGVYTYDDLAREYGESNLRQSIRRKKINIKPLNIGNGVYLNGSYLLALVSGIEDFLRNTKQNLSRFEISFVVEKLDKIRIKFYPKPYKGRLFLGGCNLNGTGKYYCIDKTNGEIIKVWWIDFTEETTENNDETGQDSEMIDFIKLDGCYSLPLLNVSKLFLKTGRNVDEYEIGFYDKEEDIVEIEFSPKRAENDQNIVVEGEKVVYCARIKDGEIIESI